MDAEGPRAKVLTHLREQQAATVRDLRLYTERLLQSLPAQYLDLRLDQLEDHLKHPASRIDRPKSPLSQKVSRFRKRAGQM